MSAGPRIRAIEESDRDAFLSLYQTAFPDKVITLKTWARIANEPATIWLTEIGDDVSSNPAAFLYFWTIADEFQIIDIGTAPECRRQGLAKILLKNLIDKARLETRRIELEVRAGNDAAIALYETQGFKKTGLRERYYGNGDAAILYSYAPRL